MRSFYVSYHGTRGKFFHAGCAIHFPCWGHTAPETYILQMKIFQPSLNFYFWRLRVYSKFIDVDKRTLPAVAAVDYELIWSLMKGADAVDDEVYGRWFLSLPSFGERASGQSWFHQKASAGGPSVDVVVLKQGLQGGLQIKHRAHVVEGTVSAGGVEIFQLPEPEFQCFSKNK